MRSPSIAALSRLRAVCRRARPGRARAADAVDERLDGPAVGTQVGELVVATDQDGTARDFRSLRGKKGLILLFSALFRLVTLLQEPGGRLRTGIWRR